MCSNLCSTNYILAIEHCLLIKNSLEITHLGGIYRQFFPFIGTFYKGNEYSTSAKAAQVLVYFIGEVLTMNIHVYLSTRADLTMAVLQHACNLFFVSRSHGHRIIQLYFPVTPS